jgi:hypothetical protein
MGKSEATQSAGKGLAGVIALETEICDIDGQDGILRKLPTCSGMGAYPVLKSCMTWN